MIKPKLNINSSHIPMMVFFLALIIMAFVVLAHGGDNEENKDTSAPEETIALESKSFSPREEEPLKINKPEPELLPGDEILFCKERHTKQYRDLIDDLESYVEGFEGRIGLYVIDLNTRIGFGVNEDEPFVAAGSIKSAIAAELYKRVSIGEISLTDTFIYDARLYPEGDMDLTPGFLVNEPDGTELSARRISQLAITICDNSAANMMIRILGGIDSIASALNEISAIVPYRDPVEYTDFSGNEIYARHRTCAKDLALYKKHLYDLWLEYPDSFSSLVYDLKNTAFDFGMDKNLDSEIPVAHKIGTNRDLNTENDVGVVFSENPFILCVMTESEDYIYARGAIGELGNIIYKYLNP